VKLEGSTRKRRYDSLLERCGLAEIVVEGDGVRVRLWKAEEHKAWRCRSFDFAGIARISSTS
jgi:hypothetical protein